MAEERGNKWLRQKEHPRCSSAISRLTKFTGARIVASYLNFCLQFKNGVVHLLVSTVNSFANAWKIENDDGVIMEAFEQESFVIGRQKKGKATTSALCHQHHRS